MGASRSGWFVKCGLAFSLLLLGFALQAQPAYAQSNLGNAAGDARGPLPIRNARPYNLLFLQFMPESPDTTPPGKNRFDLRLDLINNLLTRGYSEGALVFEDNEYQRLTWSWRRGLTPRTELGVSVPVLWRNGGILDSLIRAWHKLWGFGQETGPLYQSTLLLDNPTTGAVIGKGNGFGLGETALTLKHSLVRATPRADLALRLGLKLPTGNPILLLGSGNADIGFSFDARYNVGRDTIFYANLGEVWMGKAYHIPGAQRSMLQAFTGIEYCPNSRDSYILQIDGSGLAVRTGNRFADGPNVTATFGYKRVLDRRHVLFVSYSENGDIHDYKLPYFSNVGPDITFSMGLEWRP